VSSLINCFQFVNTIIFCSNDNEQCLLVHGLLLLCLHSFIQKSSLFTRHSIGNVATALKKHRERGFVVVMENSLYGSVPHIGTYSNPKIRDHNCWVYVIPNSWRRSQNDVVVRGTFCHPILCRSAHKMCTLWEFFPLYARAGSQSWDYFSIYGCVCKLRYIITCGSGDIPAIYEAQPLRS